MEKLFRRAALACWSSILLLVLVIGLFGTQAPHHSAGSLALVDRGTDLAIERGAAIQVAAPETVPVAQAGPSGPPPPGRLIVPRIGVNAQVLGVGIAKDGSMAVTNESYTVGWYKLGTAPGDPGDAVMTGHLDWYDTSHAVFFNLKNLRAGDDIEVQRLDGVTKHFRVTSVATVAYNASVPGLFAGNGPARLSLITCGGPWDSHKGEYLQRVIVDAALVADISPMGDLPGGMDLEVNGLKFHVVDAGTGPGVLLLHGFPDSSALWRNQVPALVDAGFRVVAPDLRGFGQSDKPQDVEAYRMGEVLDDIKGILRTLGVPKVHVVGHDWGATVAWMFTITQPQKVDRLAAISVGHPGMFFRPSLRQMQLSWYTLLFQFPGVAEVLLARDDWSFLKGWTAGGGDLDRYQEDLARPGALTSALNWYRANLNPQRLVEPVPDFPPIEGPVLGIWGSQDVAVAEETMTGSSRYVSGPWRYERFEDAGHWIPLEQPEALNDILLEFFARAPREPRAQPDVRASVGRHTTGALAERLQGRTPDSEAE